MSRIRSEPDRLANVSEYPETSRGGAWDHQLYAGTPDAALDQARAVARERRYFIRTRGARPNWLANAAQIWYDEWRRAWRVLRYDGPCVVCGRRTYSFDDGENDPRGVLGDRAAQAVTQEDVPALGDREYVPACFLCMNEEPSYRRALDIARRLTERRVPA